MELLPESAGPHDPATATPIRRPGSIRRTSTIDSSRPDGMRGDLVVAARARDLRTDTGPESDLRTETGTVVAETELRLRLQGMTREIISISATPASDGEGLEPLVGLAVGPGFRARVNDALPDEHLTGSLRYLLLDDLVGASLVSGYALQRSGIFDTPPGEEPSPEATRMAAGMASVQLANEDLCAGWARDSAMMVAIRAKGVIPTPMGPPAPPLGSSDDPRAWHTMDPLAPHAMRRRRRLDVVAVDRPDATHLLDLHFRDTHVDGDGVETVVHEYSVEGAVDAAAGQVVALSARAHVLPWMECPGALGSAGRLAGMPLDDLRKRVRRELTGTSTCTHLNDMLRSLSDVPILVDELGAGHAPTATPRPVP
jgi:hypothetical protein